MTVDESPLAQRRFFAVSSAVLCGVGLLVMLLGHWLVTDVQHKPGGGRDGPPAELRMLQPLVTGNLAVFLAWVWLDLRASRQAGKDADARLGLWFVATVVAGISTFGGAAWAGVLEREPFIPFLLFLVAPVLVVAVPLLWVAARRIERSWLRALMLAGVVMVSAIAQQGHITGNDAELRVFTMNSCLIGLAVTLWLLTWTVEPPPADQPAVGRSDEG